MQTYPSGGGNKEQYYTVVEEVDYVVKDDYHYNKGSKVQMMKPATNHSYDDHNKHAHQSYGECDLHNKNGHNKGYGGYDDYDKHMHEGYGGYDQNTHGYGGPHNNRNKYCGGGCSAAMYSENWYGKEEVNRYCANQRPNKGPIVVRWPVWQKRFEVEPHP